MVEVEVGNITTLLRDVIDALCGDIWNLASSPVDAAATR